MHDDWKIRPDLMTMQKLIHGPLGPAADYVLKLTEVEREKVKALLLARKPELWEAICIWLQAGNKGVLPF